VRALWGLMLLFAVALVAGCGDGPDIPDSQEEAERIVSEYRARTAAAADAPAEDSFLTQRDWPDVLTDADAFSGRTADSIVGRVFVVERDGSTVVLQVNTSRDLSDGNTIVRVDDAAFARAIRENDFVRFSGEVRGSFTGTNAFGGEVIAPVVDAFLARKVPAADAIVAADPPIATKDLNVVGSQSGLVMTVKRADRLDNGGRVTVEARNGTGSPASIYGTSAVLVQGDSQSEAEISFELPDFPSELQPGVTATAVLIFPGMRRGPATLVIEWYSDNFEISAEPFRLSFRAP
jgi:hypothetical protein